ncbi:MAG: transcription elongation factor GreA [Negativicutes bacterium]|nr:transcription elongation factor GreA [Negativicutes bacterium]
MSKDVNKVEKEMILTPEGLKKIEDKLEHLKSIRRQEVSERIKQAIGFGDISENSEYDDAKNEQAFIEGEILELEKISRSARLIDTGDIKENEVGIGSTVKLKDIEFGEIDQFIIVGSAEAEPINNRISNESPVGRAVLGKRAGDIVSVNSPDGKIKYKIMEIVK